MKASDSGAGTSTVLSGRDISKLSKFGGTGCARCKWVLPAKMRNSSRSSPESLAFSSNGLLYGSGSFGASSEVKEFEGVGST